MFGLIMGGLLFTAVFSHILFMFNLSTTITFKLCSSRFWVHSVCIHGCRMLCQTSNCHDSSTDPGDDADRINGTDEGSLSLFCLQRTRNSIEIVPVCCVIALYQLVSPILARIGCFHVRFGALPAFSDHRSVAGGEEAIFVCPRLRERFRKFLQ
ncbi:hypothetical protein BJX66DRAFT_50828 [Aspergillus keveii]|uniref:Secreted protein n=1 Tax=Aspergillus keveii TaxID=714993 RepID=A0ABR4FRT5_9EURO